MLEIKNVYKTFNAGAQWGIFNQDVPRIDIQTASYAEILQFVTTQTRTGAFVFNAAEMGNLIVRA